MCPPPALTYLTIHMQGHHLVWILLFHSYQIITHTLHLGFTHGIAIRLPTGVWWKRSNNATILLTLHYYKREILWGTANVYCDKVYFHIYNAELQNYTLKLSLQHLKAPLLSKSKNMALNFCFIMMTSHYCWTQFWTSYSNCCTTLCVNEILLTNV